jgi:hypothetical protein
MPNRNLIAPGVCLALFAACGVGYTKGPVSPPGDGGPIGITPSDAGSSDAGDAGLADGGDAGARDGGCAPGFQGFAKDFCFSSFPPVENVNVAVNPATCTVSFSLSGLTCTGSVAGAGNQFDGGCNSYACSSTSLPGNIACATTPTTSCSITICLAPDGGCSP